MEHARALYAWCGILSAPVAATSAALFLFGVRGKVSELFARPWDIATVRPIIGTLQAAITFDIFWYVLLAGMIAGITRKAPVLRVWGLLFVIVGAGGAVVWVTQGLSRVAEDPAAFVDTTELVWIKLWQMIAAAILASWLILIRDRIGGVVRVLAFATAACSAATAVLRILGNEVEVGAAVFLMLSLLSLFGGAWGLTELRRLRTAT